MPQSHMAGVAGLEPTHAGFRIPCLTNLAMPLGLHDSSALSTKNIIRNLPLSVKDFHENISANFHKKEKSVTCPPKMPKFML